MDTRIRHARALAAVVSVAAIAATGPVASASAATGVTSTALPLTGYTSIVADLNHHHLFVSGGGSDNAIVVTDFDGNLVTTIAGEPGASSLALSKNGHTLYAALGGADAISAIDTRTLTETARYTTGAGAGPETLAVVGDEVWFGYGGPAAAGIGVLDPKHATVTLTPERTFYSAPLLASSPSAPGVLVAGEVAVGPSVVARFDVSSGAPVMTAKTDPWTANGCEFVHGLAISVDGADVLVACGYPYYATSFSLTDLTQDATYQTGPYTGAVGAGPGGQIAVGVYASSAVAYLFNPGGSTPTASYTLGGFGVYGFAWSKHDRKLFAVSGGVRGDDPVLNVIDLS